MIMKALFSKFWRRVIATCFIIYSGVHQRLNGIASLLSGVCKHLASVTQMDLVGLAAIGLSHKHEPGTLPVPNG